MGSLPLVMNAKTESSLMLHTRYLRGPRCFIADNRSLRFAGSSDSTLGFLKSVGEGGSKLSLVRRRGVVTLPRAARKGSVDGGGESEDVLQATIEKSKRVIAKQRDLLQQISDKRKVLSSKNNSIIHQENIVHSEASDNDLEEHSKDNVFDNDGPEFLRSPVSRVFDENKNPGMSLPLKQPSNLEEVMENDLPSFLSFISGNPSLEDTKDESSKEPSLQDKDGEMNGALPEDVKSPPLAGDNVMNVILVAVECAPWSKTGGLGDVAGSLPKALARRGHRVMVIAPMYDNYKEAQQVGVRKRYKVEGQDVEVVYYHAFIYGVDFVFMEAAMFRHMGNDIYGGNRMYEEVLVAAKYKW